METIGQSGIDLFLKMDRWKQKKLAFLTNDAAHTVGGVKSRAALLHAGFHVCFLFSPEHGLKASAPDGAAVPDGKDELTPLKVYSLYGRSQQVDVRLLEMVDAVVYDIPDVGCRFYTYLWTLTYLMEACALCSKPLIILDRPNPLGGDLELSEGPMLDEENCASFLGRWRIPIRHSCTTGELARMFQESHLPGLDLEVVPCSGWQRKVDFQQQGYRFYPTSPAIQQIETALLYTGMGLLEGINVQEGRGTGHPFRQAGAPWIDALDWLKSLEGSDLKGIELQPVSFTPEWGLYAGEICQGLYFQVTQPGVFRPVTFAWQVMTSLVKQYPEKLKPRLYKTAANPSGSRHLDLLTGLPESFELLKSGKALPTDVRASWSRFMEPYLLYT